MDINNFLAVSLPIFLPILAGVLGFMLNKWVGNYCDDKHFFKTRFLDVDGKPGTDDAGYLKDASGTMIPIIVKKYHFGRRKNQRKVEYLEITSDGESGYPGCMSLAAFRSQVILRPARVLTSMEVAMVQARRLLLPDNLDFVEGEIAKYMPYSPHQGDVGCEHGDQSVRLADRVVRVEFLQEEQSQKISQDMMSIFGKITDLLAIGAKFDKWQLDRPVAMGKLRKRVAVLEEAAKAKHKS